MARYDALRAHLNTGGSITAKNGSLKKIGFTATPASNEVLVALSAAESALGYSTAAVEASRDYRNSKSLLIISDDRTVLGTEAGSLALATDSSISSVAEFGPADAEAITQKWGWGLQGILGAAPNAGGQFFWTTWSERYSSNWSANRQIAVDKGVEGRLCLDLKTSHDARAAFIRDVTGVTKPLVDSVWVPSGESPGSMATNPGMHAALSTWSRKGLIGVAIPWQAAANGYVIGYYLPGPGVAGIPMVGYAFQEENGQTFYGLAFSLSKFWAVVPTHTYTPKLVPCFNVQVPDAHPIQSVTGSISFSAPGNVAPAPTENWQRIGCVFTGQVEPVSNPFPAVPGFASVNDWLSSRYPIYVGHALGQPITATLTVLLGPAVSTGGGVEVDEEAVVVGIRGTDLRLIAEGSDTMTFTPDQWSEMGAQYYQTLIERVARRVSSDPLVETRTYPLAVEADLDLRAEVMVPATETNPSVTFGMASARAAGKASRIWHLIRATQDVEGYAGGEITLTAADSAVTASIVVDGVTLTDEEAISDALVAGAPVKIVTDGSVEDPYYTYFGTSPEAFEARTSAASSVESEWVEASYRGGGLFTPASLQENFPAFGILHMGAADRSSLNGVVAGLVYHGSLVWEL